MTNSTEQSPSSEVKRSSASQEILRTLWNPKVPHRIHNSPSPVPTWAKLIQPMPHHPTSRRSFLILLSHYASNGFFPSVLPHQHPVCNSPVSHTCYMLIHLILIDVTVFLTTALTQRWVFSLTVLPLYLRWELPVANRREGCLGCSDRLKRAANRKMSALDQNRTPVVSHAGFAVQTDTEIPVSDKNMASLTQHFKFCAPTTTAVIRTS